MQQGKTSWPALNCTGDPRLAAELVETVPITSCFCARSVQLLRPGCGGSFVRILCIVGADRRLASPRQRWLWRGMLEHLLDGLQLQLHSLFLFHTRLSFHVA